MHRTPEIKTGDVLQRKRTQLIGVKAQELWVLCSVMDVEDGRVHVRYNDGSEEIIERGRGHLRYPPEML